MNTKHTHEEMKEFCRDMYEGCLDSANSLSPTIPDYLKAMDRRHAAAWNGHLATLERHELDEECCVAAHCQFGFSKTLGGKYEEHSDDYTDLVTWLDEVMG